MDNMARQTAITLLCSWPSATSQKGCPPCVPKTPCHFLNSVHQIFHRLSHLPNPRCASWWGVGGYANDHEEFLLAQLDSHGSGCVSGWGH